MNKYNDLAIIILAAGSSSRMGTSKQLLMLNGITLLEHTANCAMDSGLQNIVVVLGSNSVRHEEILTGKPITVVVNHDWAKGMGNSLKAGLREALEKFPSIKAVIVLVCDQPALTTKHIVSMAEEFLRSKPVAIASAYQNVFGVPALVHEHLFPQILNIRDQSGAKEILSKAGKELMQMPFEGGELDMDTLEDYNRYIKSLN